MGAAEVIALLHTHAAGEFSVKVEDVFISRIEDDIWRTATESEVAGEPAPADVYTVVVGNRTCSDWQWMSEEDYVGYQNEGRSSWYLLQGDTLVAWDHWSYLARCVPENSFHPARAENRRTEKELLRFVAQRFPNPTSPAAIRFDRGMAYVDAGRLDDARSMLQAGDRAIDSIVNDYQHREHGATRDALRDEETRLRRKRSELSVAIDRAVIAERGLPTDPEDRYFRGLEK